MRREDVATTWAAGMAMIATPRRVRVPDSCEPSAARASGDSVTDSPPPRETTARVSPAHVGKRALKSPAARTHCARRETSAAAQDRPQVARGSRSRSRSRIRRRTPPPLDASAVVSRGLRLPNQSSLQRTRQLGYLYAEGRGLRDEPRAGSRSGSNHRAKRAVPQSPPSSVDTRRPNPCLTPTHTPANGPISPSRPNTPP